MKRSERLAFAATALALATAAAASETVTYTYDSLGRLTAVSTSGGINDGVTVAAGYDPAGNRTAYGVGGTGGPPPPPPPGGNQPPVAVNDAGSMTKCLEKTFAVLANDSDPDGNTPLALVSVSGGAPRGTPSIWGTSILFTPNGFTGTAVVTYVMRDSLGATASATLTITITSGTCGND